MALTTERFQGPGFAASDILSALKLSKSTGGLSNLPVQPVDLSPFIRKTSEAAQALAGFSDVWKGERSDTGQEVSLVSFWSR